MDVLQTATLSIPPTKYATLEEAGDEAGAIYCNHVARPRLDQTILLAWVYA